MNPQSNSNQRSIDESNLKNVKKSSYSIVPDDCGTIIGSRIKLLQQQLLENKTSLNQPNERAEREKELKQLAAYHLVNFDINDEENIDITIKKNIFEQSKGSDIISSDFPSIPSYSTKSSKPHDHSSEYIYQNDTILSSEWRDETIINSSQYKHTGNDVILSPPSYDDYNTPTSHNNNNNYNMDIESIELNDLSTEKIHSLDTTMDCLEELNLLPKKQGQNCQPNLISTVIINSEPTSPTKLNISKRDQSYNGTLLDSSHINSTSKLMDNSLSPPVMNDIHHKMLVKTSTKFKTTQIQQKNNFISENNKLFSNINDENDSEATLTRNRVSSFTRNIGINRNLSPLVSTPLNMKDMYTTNSTRIPKIETTCETSLKNKLTDQFKPTNSPINDSDSYVSRLDTSRIEDRKEYHVKRRSLSTGQTRAISTIPFMKTKSAGVTSCTTKNYSIGFNPSLNSYDHPDDASKNLSFSTFESICALHNNNTKEVLIKKYYIAAKVQQQIISQSENVLNLIYSKNSNINDSARLPCCLDAESLLLLSTYRRNLFLHKASKLKRGTIPCKCDPESRKIATASVSVSDIYIQVDESFTNALKCAQPNSYYYFLAIITFGESDVVFCTTPISIYDLNSKNLLLLPGTFSSTDMRCDESVNVEIYARTLSNKKDTTKLNDLLKIRFRKRHIRTPNNNTNWKDRECAFKFVGSCAIPITEKNFDSLTLFNRVTNIPLGSRLSVKMCLQPNYESYAQGFLSLYKMEGGLPSWRRYWCVLQKSSLKMWNWKDDDPNDCVISINLNWDVESFCKILPQHICARSNTIEINLLNNFNTRNSIAEFIGKPTSNTSSSRNYSIWLSADNTTECTDWLRALSLHLIRHKDWIRVMSSRQPSVPSRRLV